ncbi:MAG: SMC-Scp complex subunit ScpB [Deferribacteraceae bacterium]|jgi:segregation and condensation protein B|nr:SMC-Scp complex subunit ScpB [Deferribacteraceae bacterium]
MTEDLERKLFIAALFLSGKPLDMPILKKFLNPADLEGRLATYVEDFNKQNNGIHIRMISGGFQIVASSELSPILEQHFGERTEQLSRGALETLSVIAYKQPATKAEIEQIRGVDCSGSMRSLLDKNLIISSGRKNVPGRPLIYITSKYFLEFFGLNDLSELPSFREWQELRTKDV